FTPSADYGFNTTSDPKMVWVGIDRVNDQPVYSVGQGDRGPAADAVKLDEQGAVRKVEELLAEGPVEVRIPAERRLPYEVVKGMTVLLEQRRHRGVRKIFAEVSGRENP